MFLGKDRFVGGSRPRVFKLLPWISLLLKLEFVVLSILRELYLININRVQEKLS